jgi:hypothetical protein
MALVRNTIVLAALALTGATAAPAAPQSRLPAQPSAARTAAWDRLRASSLGPDASVAWSAVDDVPISVRAGSGASPLPAWERDRNAAVLAWVLGNAELFRLRPGIDAFQVAGERVHNRIHHQRIVQAWHGIPVRGGQYMVSVGADGRLRMMAGRSVPDIDADPAPVLTRTQAIAAAATSRDRAPGRDSVTARLAIEPREGRDLLVWEVRLQSRTRPRRGRSGRCSFRHHRRDPGPGVRSERLRRGVDPQSRSSAARRGFRDRRSGRGRRAARGQPSARDPRDRCRGDLLDGARSAGLLRLPLRPGRREGAFEQANVYWHMDHFLREFHGGNGFAGMPQPITVLLRAFECGNPNTGQTIGNTIWLTSEGCGYKASTRDADIIDHEASTR